MKRNFAASKLLLLMIDGILRIQLNIYLRRLFHSNSLAVASYCSAVASTSHSTVTQHLRPAVSSVSSQHPIADASGELLPRDFSTDTSDSIDDGWWLPFSDYRLEDYYTVQARLDNEADRPFPQLDENVDYDNPVTGDLPTRDFGMAGELPSASVLLAAEGHLPL